MTNEQKLSKLIQIAVENGYNLYWWDALANKAIDEKAFKIINTYIVFLDFYEYITSLSLNDLILDFEKDKIEVSFIEALCKHCNKNMSKEDFYKWSDSFRTHIDFYFEYEELEFLWSFKITTRNRIDKRPTSERLEWLFETFKHLL